MVTLPLKEATLVSYMPDAQALRGYTRIPFPVGRISRGDQSEPNRSRNGLDTLHAATSYLQLPEMSSGR
jgi:hypothetical protein